MSFENIFKKGGKGRKDKTVYDRGKIIDALKSILKSGQFFHDGSKGGEDLWRRIKLLGDKTGQPLEEEDLNRLAEILKEGKKMHQLLEEIEKIIESMKNTVVDPEKGITEFDIVKKVAEEDYKRWHVNRPADIIEGLIASGSFGFSGAILWERIFLNNLATGGEYVLIAFLLMIVGGETLDNVLARLSPGKKLKFIETRIIRKALKMALDKLKNKENTENPDE